MRSGKTKVSTNPDMLTIHEVARHLRVDSTTVRRWIARGAIDAIVLPHKGHRQAYRIKRETLDAVLNGEMEV